MNVTACQEKKNEETKTGKKNAVQERRQATNFKKAVLPFCCRSGSSTAKKWRVVPGVSGTLGKANSHLDPTQTGSVTAPSR